MFLKLLFTKKQKIGDVVFIFPLLSPVKVTVSDFHDINNPQYAPRAPLIASCPFLSNVMSPQVKSDYDQLKQTFAVVTWERQVAHQQRSQLQVKVDNLEQVVKVRYSMNPKLEISL